MYQRLLNLKVEKNLAQKYFKSKTNKCEVSIEDCTGVYVGFRYMIIL